jgi:hypothetical protein
LFFPFLISSFLVAARSCPRLAAPLEISPSSNSPTDQHLPRQNRICLHLRSCAVHRFTTVREFPQRQKRSSENRERTERKIKKQSSEKRRKKWSQPICKLIIFDLCARLYSSSFLASYFFQTFHLRSTKVAERHFA